MDNDLDIQGPETGGPSAPGFAPTDLLKYLPVVIQIGEAVFSGKGTFSTWTPMGKRYVRVQDHPFDDQPPSP